MYLSELEEREEVWLVHEAGDLKKKKKLSHTPKKRLKAGFSFHFLCPLDCWVPLGLMKPSELFDVRNSNTLDLGTGKLKLGSYSATYYVSLSVFSTP